MVSPVLANSNVLLVDDAPRNLVALEALLEPLGQRLVKARSGEEALKALLRDEFACILLDVRMPGLDGYETARLVRMRSKNRHVPILFITAHEATERDTLRAYASGAVDFLTKPFNPEILLGKVSAFIDLHMRERQVVAHEAELRRKESELSEKKRLRAEEERERFFQLAPDIFCITSLDGTFKRVNPALPKVLGWSEEELLGHPLLERVHPEDREESRAAIERLAAGNAEEAMEHRYRCKDGSYRWLAWAAHPLPESRLIYASARDRTREKAIELERARLLTEAQQAVRLRDEFLSVASHELKTPLTPLMIKLQRLKQEVQTQPPPNGLGGTKCHLSLRSLEVAEAQVRKLSRLVDELLDVSMIAQGQLSLKREQLNLSELARNTAARFEPAAEQAHCALEVDASGEVVGRWDRFRLEQVVGNLLSNAIKYGAGEPVRLSVTEKEGKPQLSVWDRGIGIAAESISRIFGKFERAVSERHYGGLGLGLYVTRQIVEAHGGSIRAESEPGKGAAFIVELPSSS